MAAYNFKSQKWIYLFGENNAVEPAATELTATKQKTAQVNSSPTRIPGVNNQSLKRRMTVAKVEDPPIVKLKEPKKKVEELPGIELTDPTSLTLINSFLIKNAGPTFDNYHKTMQ